MNYNFEQMVDEAYEKLNNDIDNYINNLKLPTIDYESTATRLHWKNIMMYIQMINRTPEHFLSFMKNELCNKEINWYSANKEDGLIIHGKYLKSSIVHNLIIKYINIYVICSSCKNINTVLNKITTKKYEFKCLSCEMIKII